MEKDNLKVVARFEGDFYSVKIHGSWNTGSWSWEIGIAKNMRVVYDPEFNHQLLRYQFHPILPSKTGDWRNCSVSHYHERSISARGLSFLASDFGIYETLDQAKAFVVSEIQKGQSILTKRQEAALNEVRSLQSLISRRLLELYSVKTEMEYEVLSKIPEE